eukprot:TRINITY_DN5262_c0_g1_i1.p1 TRINITY_DN5262_c0_g1~~TRINITY_DN5262_c0_g1_i1.p1  ORF type:complete len:1185 (+),score=115.86 TRINITY_DN5262_c0_g1_i1:91-3555(+)
MTSSMLYIHRAHGAVPLSVNSALSVTFCNKLGRRALPEEIEHLQCTQCERITDVRASGSVANGKLLLRGFECADDAELSLSLPCARTSLHVDAGTGEMWILLVCMQGDLGQLETDKDMDVMDACWLIWPSDGNFKDTISSMYAAGAIRHDFETLFVLDDRVIGIGNNVQVMLARRNQSSSAQSSIEGDPTGPANTVAVKKTNADFPRKQLLKEMTMLVAVQGHPNVIDLHGLFLLEEYPSVSFGIVQRWCEGGDLSNVIVGGPCRERHIFTIFSEVLCGLEFVHSRGVVHRDVKAENIVIARGGCMLVDFGNAAFEHDRASMTKKRGSKPYVAPELLLNNLDGCSYPMDIFSCGVLFLYLSSAKLPFGKGRDNPRCINQLVIGEVHRANKARTAVGLEKLRKSAQTMISCMCLQDPSERPSASKLLTVSRSLAQRRARDEASNPQNESNRQNGSSSQSDAGNSMAQRPRRSSAPAAPAEEIPQRSEVVNHANQTHELRTPTESKIVSIRNAQMPFPRRHSAPDASICMQPDLGVTSKSCQKEDRGEENASNRQNGSNSQSDGGNPLRSSPPAAPAEEFPQRSEVVNHADQTHELRTPTESKIVSIRNAQMPFPRRHSAPDASICMQPDFGVTSKSCQQEDRAEEVCKHQCPHSVHGELRLQSNGKRLDWFSDSTAFADDLHSFTSNDFDAAAGESHSQNESGDLGSMHLSMSAAHSTISEMKPRLLQQLKLQEGQQRQQQHATHAAVLRSHPHVTPRSPLPSAEEERPAVAPSPLLPATPRVCVPLQSRITPKSFVSLPTGVLEARSAAPEPQLERSPTRFRRRLATSVVIGSPPMIPVPPAAYPHAASPSPALPGVFSGHGEAKITSCPLVQQVDVPCAPSIQSQPQHGRYRRKVGAPVRSDDVTSSLTMFDGLGASRFHSQPASSDAPASGAICNTFKQVLDFRKHLAAAEAGSLVVCSYFDSVCTSPRGDTQSLCPSTFRSVPVGALEARSGRVRRNSLVERLHASVEASRTEEGVGLDVGNVCTDLSEASSEVSSGLQAATFRQQMAKLRVDDDSSDEEAEQETKQVGLHSSKSDNPKEISNKFHSIPPTDIAEETGSPPRRLGARRFNTTPVRVMADEMQTSSQAPCGRPVLRHRRAYTMFAIREERAS